MEVFDKVLIIVPSLSPDEKMIRLLENLRDGGFPHVMVIDDGSAAGYRPIFDRAEQEFGCRVLRHYINYGKGRALKTAFNAYMNDYPGFEGVVTVDSDGQHTVEDVRACIAAMREHPDALILGARDFGEANVPFRSRFGNLFTAKVFGWLCGVHVSDTQTGLRAMATPVVENFLATKGERFEFEMNQLVDCAEKSIPIVEVPIKTIYIEENKSSHFHPIKDSARVYAVFGKFMLSSFSAVLIDLIVYRLMLAILPGDVKTIGNPFDVASFAELLGIVGAFIASSTFLATVIARVMSATYNFTVNRKAVFHNHGNVVTTFLKYVAIAIPIMIVSATVVSLLTGLWSLSDNLSLLLKMVVDTILFFVNFFVQRTWVFKK